MPAKMLMTWVPSAKRWAKKHNGTSYSVSCRQLRVPPTKEASYHAANVWWQAKEKELEEAVKPPPDPLTDTLVNAMGNGRLQEAVEMFMAAGPVSWMIRQFTGMVTSNPTSAGLAGKEFARLVEVGEITPEQIRNALGSMYPEDDRGFKERTLKLLGIEDVPLDKTISAQVTAWLATLRPQADSGQMDHGRYDSYRREVNLFRDWAGGEQSVESIAFTRLESYRSHLLTKITERQQDKTKGYSAGYAHGMLGTVKRFAEWLADRGLIPRLGLNSLRIKKGVKKVEVFTVDEIKILLDGCKNEVPKTGLYLLLMLNCGMYQGDESDLGKDEVDLKKGTIKRPRSKTPGGPVVTYPLWPETLELLRRYAVPDDGPVVLNPRGHPRILLTEEDKPLVQKSLHDDGRLSKSDNVQSAYRRLLDRLNLDDSKELRQIRKTSSTLLGHHPAYKYYQQYFLAQSPRTVAEKHYVIPSDEEFAEAVTWLRKKYGLG